MIGIVVAGHGHFAEGLLSSLKMIAGVPEKVVAVNFLEGDSTDTLEKEVLKEIQEKGCNRKTQEKAHGQTESREY